MDQKFRQEKVSEVEGTDVPVYIVNDKNMFSITDFKVMENLVSVLPCVKASLNGKIQLVYLTGGLKPLKSIVSQLNDEKAARIVGAFLDALMEVNGNGFLRDNNLDIGPDKIFLDPENLAVKLVYLPLNPATGEYGLTVNEVNNAILSMVEKTSNPDSGIISAIKLFCETNKETSIENCRNLYKLLLQQYKIGETKSSIKTDLILSFSDGEQKREFRISEDSFRIGHKEGSADGLIKNNKYVSSPHCEISRENGSWFIKDLDSTNGTFVNGSRLERNKKTEINDTDAIRLANSTLYVEIRRSGLG